MRSQWEKLRGWKNEKAEINDRGGGWVGNRTGSGEERLMCNFGWKGRWKGCWYCKARGLLSQNVYLYCTCHYFSILSETLQPLPYVSWKTISGTEILFHIYTCVCVCTHTCIWINPPTMHAWSWGGIEKFLAYPFPKIFIKH